MNFYFMTDNDGHWYRVPAGVEDRFIALVDDGDDDTINAEFSLYHCDHPSNYLVTEAA